MSSRILSTLVFTIGFINLLAQSTLPNLPPSVKWQQINTTHFKIIFPKGFETQGQRMANTMEHLYTPASKSLNSEPRKVPIIMQNQHAVSNGFVTLGPRRSEFFTMSPQNYNLAGTTDWLDMLAVHEFRHVVQYDRSRVGFSNFVYYLLGDNTFNATASASVPSWFWEGDAVGVETALTHAGRGRFPNFSMVFRANLLEKGAFNYSKQYLRSYKDFIPSHYELGYHFSTYIKNNYGLESMEQIVDKTWRVPFIPFEYSFAMQKYTKQKMPELYLNMMADLKQKWQNQIEAEVLTGFTPIPIKESNILTNYNYPQPLDDGSVLVLKNGLGDINTLVSIDPTRGEVTKEYVLGPINNPGFLSAAGNTVVWTEFRYDSRWLTKSYSEINTYNLATGHYKQLTTKSRLSGAAISPDRSKIVAIENTTDYKNSLVVLDAYSGKELSRIENSNKAFYSMPRWNEQSNAIVVLNQFDQKKGILLIDIDTKEEKLLLPYTNEHIGHPIIDGDHLFFNSAFSGIDNIYALHLETKKKYRITSAKYGASNPALSLDGTKLYYNNYTVNGNRVVSIPLDESGWVPIENVKNTDIKFYQPMVEKESNGDILLTVPDTTYQITRYRKKPFKIHSWGPLFTGSLTEIEAGIYSQNLLSTTDIFAGVEFDFEGNIKGVGRVSYQSLYPIIDVTATYGKRVSNTSYRDTLGVVQPDQITWTESTLKGGLRIPWLLTRSKFNTRVEVYNYVGVTSVSSFESNAFGDSRYFFNQLGNGMLLQNEFVFKIFNLLNQSHRDIFSKFGQTFTFENYSTPYGGDFDAGLTALKTQLYFPGFVKHHSLNFFAGWQHQKITLNSNEYWFNNRMPYPRGHPARVFEDFYVIRSNYDLPLLYPDLRIGPFLYIQRIKAKLFYDYGYGKTDVTNADTNLQWKIADAYQSTGVDLTFDFNVMRALPQLELGVRFVYLPDLQQTQFEFLVGSIGF